MSDRDATASTRRKPGLGRGLDALFGEQRAPASAESAAGPAGGGLRQLPVGSISPHPGQPRRHFDEAALAELADSIAEHGILQPIVVRPQGSGYQIVAGERRWRAAQRARLHEIPAIVREIDEQQLLEIALIENIQRADLTPIEEAEAYRALIDQHGYSTTDLARRIDKSRSHVANLMRLLDLPEPVRAMVSAGELSMGHARALIGLQEEEALAVARAVGSDGLSVRAVERLVQRRRRGGPATGPGRVETKSDADADLAALDSRLSEQLGVRVRIVPGAQADAGTVSLAYSNFDQLDMIIERLTGDRL